MRSYIFRFLHRFRGASLRGRNRWKYTLSCQSSVPIGKFGIGHGVIRLVHFLFESRLQKYNAISCIRTRKEQVERQGKPERRSLSVFWRDVTPFRVLLMSHVPKCMHVTVLRLCDLCHFAFSLLIVYYLDHYTSQFRCPYGLIISFTSKNGKK